jgi:thiamine biosynthesis lipoprotein
VSAGAKFPALGTTAVVVTEDQEALPGARAAVERELAAIDLACSRFRPDSELSRINAAAGRETPAGPLLLEALRIALRVAAATGGLVVPTVGRALRLAGYDRTFQVVVSRDPASFHARFERVPEVDTVELDERRGTILVREDVELDLGATAKALAADRAAAAAHETTGCGVVVSLGGDVSVAGPTPSDGWPILIADDHAAPLDGPGPVVALRDGGLASSGTAVRRWRAGEVELHHIVDPRTGRPADTPWRTATVAAASCVEANTAATAAVVLGTEAPRWLESLGLPARLVPADGGAAVAVGGWPAEEAA